MVKDKGDDHCQCPGRGVKGSDEGNKKGLRLKIIVWVPLCQGEKSRAETQRRESKIYAKEAERMGKGKY